MPIVIKKIAFFHAKYQHFKEDSEGFYHIYFRLPWHWDINVQLYLVLFKASLVVSFYRFQFTLPWVHIKNSIL